MWSRLPSVTPGISRRCEKVAGSELESTQREKPGPWGQVRAGAARCCHVPGEGCKPLRGAQPRTREHLAVLRCSHLLAAGQ